ncbi:MAG: uracil-DNA glycosylase family protein [Halolamina sp.]
MSDEESAADAGADADAGTDADADAVTDPEPTHPTPGDRLAVEPGCARCPALADCRETISWGNGPTDAAVVVVGEAPGYGGPEAETWRGGNWSGFAYTSRHSGRRVRRLFAALGYDPFFTNAVKCFPADSNEPTTNREPTPVERAACRDHLAAELGAVNPAVVVATGKHATATLLAADGCDLDGFVDRVLEPVRLDAFDVRLVPILHPSYQDVWLARLGYDETTYREELGALLP